jgi:hypothetical protein
MIKQINKKTMTINKLKTISNSQNYRKILKKKEICVKSS